MPRLGMRWPGFRKVRRQVCKRVRRRIAELNLESVAAYEDYLLGHGAEWARVARRCRITISRFYRDQAVFCSLAGEVLPALQDQAVAGGQRTMRGWSVGCASGEEPYTLALLWELQLKQETGCDLQIVATDSDPLLLSRAKTACYHASSLKELPAPLLGRGFDRQGERYCLRPEIRSRVAFLCQDIRDGALPGPFALILCRNLAFTYFAKELQSRLLSTFHHCLVPDGALIIGCHEALPRNGLFLPWPRAPHVFQKI
ncbi:MAG: chemotaxis protein CheR [Deltaproteobacteria bacterium]|nr:chemotaxis protein CheR [Deltaproteobacteria bacterium]